jgi:hypothetical protein
VRDQAHAASYGILEVVNRESPQIDEVATCAFGRNRNRRNVERTSEVHEKVIDPGGAVDGVAVDLYDIDTQSTQSNQDPSETAGIVGDLDA